MKITVPYCRTIIGIHNVGIAAYLCAVVLLIGCSSVPYSYVVKKESSVTDSSYKATLEVALYEDRFLSVSIVQNPKEREAMSQSLSTAHQSTTAPPGTSPGEMAAAYIITTFLVRAGADSNLRSKANDKALVLTELFKRESRNVQRVVALIQEQFMEMKSAKLEKSATSEDCCKHHIIVCPQVQLSNDLRVLEVKIDFTVIDKNIDEVIYKNSFIYITDPAPSESVISYWTDADAQQFFQVFDTALGEIVKMIDFDLLPREGRMQEEKVSTIKYRNEMGIFYVRGTLLSNRDQRIILRDLRGNLRSFSGELL